MARRAEYCPVSLATEVVGERWTLLILRELFSGSRGFNDIHRGLPGLSRTLLSQRLRTLGHQGLIESVAGDGSGSQGYRLTAKGAALRPVLIGLGEWSVQWCFPAPTDEQLDPQLVLWRLRSGLVQENLPDRRVAVELTVDQERGPVRGWLVLDGEHSSYCTRDPLFPVDVHAGASSRVWHELWFGHRGWRAAREAGDLELSGEAELLSAFPTWFRRSEFADQVARRRGMSELADEPGD
jgi:DNA-binding HxlR family transcriptional regulator